MLFRFIAILAFGLAIGPGCDALAEDEWAFWRQTVIPKEHSMQIKFPLFTENNTREDCLRRLYYELSQVFATSLPPVSAVDRIEAKQQDSNLWVYRQFTRDGSVHHESRFLCRPETVDSRKSMQP